MNVLCVIPARGGSKRLPGKNIMPVRGVPIISYTIGHVKYSKLVSRIVCSTDDSAIAAVAAAEGIQVIERPADISNDNAGIDDALRHAARFLEKSDGFKSDIVVLTLANVIFRTPGLIDATIEKLIEDPGLTAAVTCYTVNQRPEWMWKKEGNRLVKVSECKYYRQQDLPEYFLPDGAVIAIRINTLMETEGEVGAYKYLGTDVGYVLQDRILSVEVDHPDDVLAAEVLLELLERRKESK